jgi:ABC-2 type transport system ATP-binding protein
MIQTKVQSRVPRSSTSEGRVPQAEGIEARALTKEFGELAAVHDLSLEVSAGEILGLLGRNGSGKTTTVRMLTTLLRPTRGQATVAGFDVVDEAAGVRRSIGVALQEAALDPNMSGREHLNLVGRLSGFGRREARSMTCRTVSAWPTSPTA